MTATTFNPLAAARNLEAAGVERRQAEAIAEEMREAADAAAGADRADLATKADLHREIGTLCSEMRWMFAFRRRIAHRTVFDSAFAGLEGTQ